MAAVMFSAPGDLAALDSARNAFLDSLFADMLGFAACKMIRRILGFAHVIDFETHSRAGAARILRGRRIGPGASAVDTSGAVPNG